MTFGTLLTAKVRGPLVAFALMCCTSWKTLILVPLALTVLLFRPPDSSWTIRFEVWRRSAMAALQHPFVGVGTSRYMFHVDQTPIPGEDNNRITAAHNEYLERVVEWGFIGGTMFLAWVLTGAMRSRTIAVMALSGAFGFMFNQPGTWGTFCILYGLATREDDLCVA